MKGLNLAKLQELAADKIYGADVLEKVECIGAVAPGEYEIDDADPRRLVIKLEGGGEIYPKIRTKRYEELVEEHGDDFHVKATLEVWVCKWLKDMYLDTPNGAWTRTKGSTDLFAY